MQDFALYHHVGSENRGCEALVKSTSAMLKARIPECGSIRLYSRKIEQDLTSAYEDIDEITKSTFDASEFPVTLSAADKIRLQLYRRQSQPKADEFYYSKFLKPLPLSEERTYLSIGGDTYCYGDDSTMHVFNKKLKELGKKTVLWGCSLDESSFSEYNAASLRTYDAIFARESGTYNLLQKKGFIDNVFLHPDPAFTLKTTCLPLPDGFQEGNTIGINASPLVFKYEDGQQKGIGMRSYIKLIDYILKHTDCSILLVPHVFWDFSDDRIVLRELYKMFESTGRMILLDKKYSSDELKGFISRCRAFIGARTHSTIAAYSSKVPTLVLGYSVKSVNIAQDLFGATDGFVVPIDQLSNESGMADAFADLMRNESTHREILDAKIPSYIENAFAAADTLNTFLKKR